MTDAILGLGALGLIFSGLLALASKLLTIEVDPREEEIMAMLPGANCGACGYPGCGGYAAAIVKGEATIDACPVGGSGLANQIGVVMGLEAEAGVKRIAVVKCRGDKDIAPARFKYDGLRTCLAANQVANGFKGCTYGCLGLGDCMTACPFDAIEMSEKNLPIINAEKCVSCGKCVLACPRNIIELLPEDKKVHVLCNSYAKGATVRKVCQEGCIACRICMKSCPVDAIVIENNIAVIDYDKCINCGICANKCPMNTIENFKKKV